jgi:predicted esterase
MVVSHVWGEKSHKALKKMITAHEPAFMTISGMGHSSDPDEMAAVKSFLKNLFQE